MTAQPRPCAWLLCAGVAIGVPQVEVLGTQTPTDAPNARITVIGCIRHSHLPDADTVGTTIIPAGETRYVLSNITLVPEGGRSGGGSPANPVAEAVNLYRLDDSADSLIAPHVGDRVQVAGTIVQPPPSAAGTTGQPTLPTAKTPRAPMLRVSSLLKISSDSTVCSQ
jgi:hypothetical protein